MSLLAVDDLAVRFEQPGRTIDAVRGVSFAIEPGEPIAIVGESGSGKSVTCASILRLLPSPPARFVRGHVRFGELDLLTCPTRALRDVRGHHIAMVFQDPLTSLSPFLRVRDQLVEAALAHHALDRRAALDRGAELLVSFGLADPQSVLAGYPHELSGGMRQRVLLAMALLTNPALLVADEPTTALDVTVQARVLAALGERVRTHGMALLLVTHDLAVVARTADRVLVMYAGELVEVAPVLDLFRAPRHPYSRALLDATPDLARSVSPGMGRGSVGLPGRPPDLSRPITGCAFAPRCPHGVSACFERSTPLVSIGVDRATRCARVAEEGLVP